MDLQFTNDFLFRYILSKPGNQDALRALVNDVLTDKKFRPVASLEVTNPLNLRATDWLKDSAMDIRATDEAGQIFNLEVQLWQEPDYAQRSLYYWAQTYVNQLKKSSEYEALLPVVCINFLNFKLLKSSPRRHSCFTLQDADQPGIVLSQDLMIHYIEMRKRDSDGLVAWMRLFDILKEGRPMTVDDQKFVASNPIFDQLKTEFDTCLQDEEARELALAREKFHRDQISRENSALRKGVMKGKLESATKLKALGVSIEIIQQATGLSLDQIDKL